MAVQQPDGDGDGGPFTPAAVERLHRALVEPMLVVPDEVAVYNGSRRYIVNADVGSCDCPDAQYNLGADEACKHALRCELALGERGLPAWADGEAVDCVLQRRLNG
jgi:predicted nucleic acid-binding Zn finger protein